ncbi:MAG: arsenate reductase (glutaredoxin) [Reichenbachiella sp.]|uniref:arsenate reductase (glutaredoxin) n=1 Tax=Reichenbachiella sp. TaxID=2184521 RepID=UPI0032654F3E
MTKIYHNPRCSKSRQALTLLNDNKENPEIIEYLKDHPTKQDLIDIVAMLGIAPLELVRKGESIFKEQYKGKELSDSEWIEAMIANPILIERPIVIKNNKAVIGRPIENIIELIR